MAVDTASLDRVAQQEAAVQAHIGKRLAIAAYQCRECGLLTTDVDIEAQNTVGSQDPDDRFCSRCGSDRPLVNFERTWPSVSDQERGILEIVLEAAEDRIASLTNRLAQEG